MRRNRLRTLIAFAMAVPVLGLATTAQADTEGRTGTFTALTYNVAGLPDALSGSEPATNSSLISPLLNAYDVVLLQESWQDHLHDLREAGLVGDEVPPTMYHHEVVGQATHPYRSEPAPHPYGTDQRRAPSEPPTISDGLNRLSRFPFGPVTRVMWEECHGGLAKTVIEEALGASGLDQVLDDAGLGAVNDETDGGAADCGAQKGFSMARTEIAPGVVVDIYNLHADASSHDRDIEARKQNFAQLTEFIVEHSKGRPVILGGDTNLKIDEDGRPVDAEVWENFRDATGLADVCDVVDCGTDDAVIDKFAFRSGSGVQVIPLSHSFERDRFVRDDGEPLADHDPLAVEFTWVRTGR